MHALTAWIVANPAEAVGIAYVLLGALNAVVPHGGEAAGVLRRLLDVLSPLTPARFLGTLKVPGMSSRAPAPPHSVDPPVQP